MGRQPQSRKLGDNTAPKVGWVPAVIWDPVSRLREGPVKYLLSFEFNRGFRTIRLPVALIRSQGLRNRPEQALSGSLAAVSA